MIRGVRQLTHLFVNYQPSHPSSRVVQEFVESPLFTQLKTKLPDVVVEPIPMRKSKPYVQAAYRQSPTEMCTTNHEWVVDTIRDWSIQFDLFAPIHTSSHLTSLCLECLVDVVLLTLCLGNNEGHNLPLVNCTTSEGVLSQCERLANQIGRAPGLLSTIKRKPFAISSTPSLQGRWTPSLHLKPFEQQLAPLQQTQTHIIGLAPPIETKTTTTTTTKSA